MNHDNKDFGKTHHGLQQAESDAKHLGMHILCNAHTPHPVHSQQNKQEKPSTKPTEKRNHLFIFADLSFVY